MSVVFPITEDPRFRRYTASEGQVSFGVPFAFQDARDVALFRLADDEYVELLPSGYTLTGAGSPTGGTATFFVGWPAGTIILVLGRAVLDRLSSIVSNGIYKSALIDGELDRNRLIQQEQARDIGRALKVGFGQSEQEVPVPDGVSLLGWSSDNKLINRPDEGTSAAVAEGWANAAQAAANGNFMFPTKASAVGANIAAGIHSVILKGDGTEGDGLGGLYIDTNNGSADTFTSNGGATTWYRAQDVSPSRLIDVNGIRDFLGLGVGPLRNPHVHPLLIDYEGHYGFNTCLFTRTDGGLTVVTRQGLKHTADDAAEIIAWETYDKGLSRINVRTAYGGASTDDRNFASVLMGSRFGVIAMRNSGGTATTPMFLYSDDQGVAWTAVALTLDAGLPANYASSPHGKIMRWPASVGGHDTTGWIVYFYSQEVIAYATTLDNGNTWSPVTPCIVGTGQLPTEMAVARVGSENKWFMVIRKEVAGSDALVSTSTNMTTWIALTSSGIELSKNPPYLVQDDDATWLYSANRKGTEISGIPLNALIVSKIDASAFYNSAGASGFSDWRIVAQLPQWGTGYMDFVEYNGEWIAAFNAGEQPFEGSTNGGGANALYLISNTPSAQGLALLQGVAQSKSAFLNSCFQVWQSGASGTGAAGRVLTADGWGLRRISGVTGHEWSRQAGSNGGYALRIQRTAANAATNALNIINVINADDMKALRGQHCNISIKVRKGAGFSAASNNLVLTVFSHTTDSQVTATDGTVPSATTLRTFTIPLDANGRWTEYDTTILVPNDAEMLWVRASYTPVGTAGAADYFELDSCILVPTPYKQPRNMRSYGEELALCQRYFCKTYASSVAPGVVTNEGALQNRARGTEALAAVNMDWRFPQEMRALPTITVYSPATGASGKLADITAAADINATAETVGRSGATIVNNAATTNGNTYRGQAVAAALPW